MNSGQLWIPDCNFNRKSSDLTWFCNLGKSTWVENHAICKSAPWALKRLKRDPLFGPQLRHQALETGAMQSLSGREQRCFCHIPEMWAAPCVSHSAQITIYLFGKEPNANVLGFAGQPIWTAALPPCCENGRIQHPVSARGRVPQNSSHAYWHLNLTQVLHVTKHYSAFEFSPQPLKKCKTILNSEAVQNTGGRLDLAWELELAKLCSKRKYRRKSYEFDKYFSGQDIKSTHHKIKNWINWTSSKLSFCGSQDCVKKMLIKRHHWDKPQTGKNIGSTCIWQRIYT